MTFTTPIFFLFLVITLVLYFILNRHYRYQNLLLLTVGYSSYGLWDWRFLILLIATTVINFAMGGAISKSLNPSHKKIYLNIAIVWTLLVLGIFKYFDFFSGSVNNLLLTFNFHLDPVLLKVILPLGISFYSFQALTYPFDIYRGKTILHKINLFDFALFVSFFPIIISGPIERATHLLPQLCETRKLNLDNIKIGITLIIWGYFQKLIIADNLAAIVNQVFDNYAKFNGLDIVIAVLAYTFQIYSDFSGYTDIARGVAKLLGFDIILNFNLPYIAINPSDFWARWNISLSSWFRDYLYIPLGGNRKGSFRTGLNLIATMTLCGLWHGAAWTFILWGFYHGVLLVIYRIFNSGLKAARTIKDAKLYSTIISILLMFILIACGWAIFRSTSLTQVAYMFTHMNLTTSIYTNEFAWKLLYFTLPVIVFYAVKIKAGNVALKVANMNPWVLGLMCGIIVAVIIIFWPREIPRFIYQGF